MSAAPSEAKIHPDVAKAHGTDQPHVWVQYKGTNLCADFHCACGVRGHIDESFAYSVRCDSCGQIWVLPQTLTLTRLEDMPESERGWLSEPSAYVQPD